MMQERQRGAGEGRCSHRGAPCRRASIGLCWTLVTLATAAWSAPGEKDLSFGTGGVAINVFSVHPLAFAVALQKDGKIVVAGSAASQFAVARFNSDGSPDLSFGTEGLVTTPFNSSDRALAVAIQKNGRIVVGGSTFLADPGGNTTRFALARFGRNGEPDDDFGAGGQVTTDLGADDDVAVGVGLQRDGQIVLAGYSGAGSNPTNIALVRYHAR